MGLPLTLKLTLLGTCCTPENERLNDSSHTDNAIDHPRGPMNGVINKADEGPKVEAGRIWMVSWPDKGPDNERIPCGRHFPPDRW